jgi:tRNA 2-thiouridine synthesizing protein E
MRAVVDFSGSNMLNSVVVGLHNIELDKDGNLARLEDWSEAVALVLARHAEIELTDAHWEVLYLMREFHQRRGIAPVMRVLVKLVENQCGPEKGNSLYLLKLFPGSPARVASKGPPQRPQ